MDIEIDAEDVISDLATQLAAKSREAAHKAAMANKLAKMLKDTQEKLAELLLKSKE
jgi:hypothetical protein